MLFEFCQLTERCGKVVLVYLQILEFEHGELVQAEVEDILIILLQYPLRASCNGC